MFVNELLCRFAWTWEDGHLAGSFASWKACCNDPNRTSYTSPSRLSAQDPWRRDLSFLPTVFSNRNDCLSLAARPLPLKRSMLDEALFMILRTQLHLDLSVSNIRVSYATQLLE